MNNRCQLWTLLSAALFSLLLFSNCNKKSVEQVVADYDVTFEMDKSFDLSLSAKACNLKENICIVLDSVFDDTRCPTGLNCVWEGNAKMRFKIKTDTSYSFFHLDTQPNSDLYHHDATVNGYKISLVELKPYPKVNTGIKLTDYAVTIEVNSPNKR
jgi:hypothetical protein